MPTYQGAAGYTYSGFDFKTVLNVCEYGADPTGTLDSTTAIQNAINAAQTAKGGIVFFPPGRFKITSTLTVNGNGNGVGVTMMGIGNTANSNTGTYSNGPGSWIVWGHSAAGKMFSASPTTGGSNPGIQGMRILGMNFDARNNDANQATSAIELVSCHAWHLEDIFIIDTTTTAIDMFTLAAGSLGEYQDCTRGTARNIQIRCIDGSAAGSAGIRMDGNATGSANTCCNYFENIVISHGGTSGLAAMELLNADSNVFQNVVVNRASGTNLGVAFRGSNSGATLVARNNVFYCSSAGAGGCTAEGTTSKTNPSLDNYFHDYQVGNGEPVPVEENGAILWWSGNGTQNSGVYATVTGNKNIVARSTASQTAGTALVDVTGMALSLVAPGKAYAFDALFFASHGSTTPAGIGIAVNLPAGATLTASAVGAIAASTAGNRNAFFTAVNAAQTGFVATTGFTAPIRISGVITLGTAATQTGNVQIRVNAASTASVQTNGVLWAQRVV